AQGVAQPDQHGQAEWGRQLVPADPAVDDLGRAVVQPPGQRVSVAGGRQARALVPPEEGPGGQPGPQGRGSAGQPRVPPQDQQLGPDDEGADAEHAQDVDDGPVGLGVVAQAPGQLLGRREGRAAVEQPDRGEGVAGGGTRGHGVLLDWSSGAARSPASDGSRSPPLGQWRVVPMASATRRSARYSSMLWARSLGLLVITSVSRSPQSSRSGQPMATASAGHHAFSQSPTRSGRCGPPLSSRLKTVSMPNGLPAVTSCTTWSCSGSRVSRSIATTVPRLWLTSTTGPLVGTLCSTVARPSWGISSRSR